MTETRFDRARRLAVSRRGDAAHESLRQVIREWLSDARGRDTLFLPVSETREGTAVMVVVGVLKLREFVLDGRVWRCAVDPEAPGEIVMGIETAKVQ